LLVSLKFWFYVDPIYAEHGSFGVETSHIALG